MSYYFFTEEEFELGVHLDGLSLFPFGVVIVWAWEWSVTDDSSASSGSDDDNSPVAEGHFNPHMESESSDKDDESPVDITSIPTKKHVVTFKCIGALYEQSRQQALEKAAMLLQQGRNVDVRLMPEPDNPYDSKAIAFQCKIEGKWCLIGYVVREVLDIVHEAMKNKFSWVKYRAMWLRSGPGFYAGIDVALEGEWPPVVVQHASTL